MEEQRALKYALRLLQMRGRSVFEVKRKLAEKKFSSSAIEQTIAKLSKLKLLDDKKFAASWVRYRSSFKPKGTRMLRLELQKFGIDKEMIDETLQSQTQEKEVALALEAAGRKKSFQKLPTEEFRQKITGFLARRGFSWDVIQKVLQKMSKNKNLE